MARPVAICSRVVAVVAKKIGVLRAIAHARITQRYFICNQFIACLVKKTFGRGKRKSPLWRAYVSALGELKQQHTGVTA